MSCYDDPRGFSLGYLGVNLMERKDGGVTDRLIPHFGGPPFAAGSGGFRTMSSGFGSGGRDSGDSGEGNSDNIFSCLVCMETYSDARFPVVFPNCGHTLCIFCATQRINSDARNCVTCRASTRNFVQGSDLKKNYALLELMNLHDVEQARWKAKERRQLTEELMQLREMKLKSEVELNDVDYERCSNCRTVENLERLQICETCIGKEYLEGNGERDEQVLSHVLCAFCCHCRGEHNGHVFRKYLPWKLNNLLSSTVSDGRDTVFLMDEVCAQEIEKGKKGMKKWFEKFRSFQTAPGRSTYSEGVAIANVLKNESDLVCIASENTLPNLRKFTKVLTDSAARMDRCLSDMKKGKSINVQEEPELQDDGWP